MKTIVLKSVSHYQNTYEISEDELKAMNVDIDSLSDYEDILDRCSLVGSHLISEDVFYKQVVTS
jgi:hypothetical protein